MFLNYFFLLIISVLIEYLLFITKISLVKNSSGFLTVCFFLHNFRLYQTPKSTANHMQPYLFFTAFSMPAYWLTDSVFLTQSTILNLYHDEHLYGAPASLHLPAWNQKMYLQDDNLHFSAFVSQQYC